MRFFGVAFVLASFWLPFALAASGGVEPVCVVKAKTVLRKGPGVQYAVSWTVPKYMPFLKISSKGNWLKVQDLDGESHWVDARSVSKKVNCAVVKTKTARLRQGPGMEKPLAELSSVDKYTPFQKVDRDGEWVQVKDSFGALYWVHENNVWIPVTRMNVEF